MPSSDTRVNQLTDVKHGLAPSPLSSPTRLPLRTTTFPPGALPPAELVTFGPVRSGHLAMSDADVISAAKINPMWRHVQFTGLDKFPYLNDEHGYVIGQCVKNGEEQLIVRVESPKVHTVHGCPTQLTVPFAYQFIEMREQGKLVRKPVRAADLNAPEKALIGPRRPRASGCQTGEVPPASPDTRQHRAQLPATAAKTGPVQEEYLTRRRRKALRRIVRQQRGLPSETEGAPSAVHGEDAASRVPEVVESPQSPPSMSTLGNGTATTLPDVNAEEYMALLSVESTAMSLLMNCGSVRNAHLTKRQRLAMRRLDQHRRRLLDLRTGSEEAVQRELRSVSTGQPAVEAVHSITLHAPSTGVMTGAEDAGKRELRYVSAGKPAADAAHSITLYAPPGQHSDTGLGLRAAASGASSAGLNVGLYSGRTSSFF